MGQSASTRKSLKTTQRSTRDDATIHVGGVVHSWDDARGFGRIKAYGNIDDINPDGFVRCYYGALCQGRGGCLIEGRRVSFVVRHITLSDTLSDTAVQVPVAVEVDGSGVAWRTTPSADAEWSTHLRRVSWWVGASEDASRPPQPAEVAPGLYLGGVDEAKEISLLQYHEIDCVLCMALEMCRGRERQYSHEVEVLNIDAKDSEQYDLFMNDVPQALEFIARCKSQGRRVLVYCSEGANRGSAVCAAWLLSYERVPLGDTIRRLARCRGVVLQNDRFMRGLVSMAREKELLCDAGDTM